MAGMRPTYAIGDRVLITDGDEVDTPGEVVRYWNAARPCSAPYPYYVLVNGENEPRLFSDRHLRRALAHATTAKGD